MALSNLTKVQTVGIGSNIEVVGVVTTGQFKSGTSNLHSTGIELTNLNVSGIATIGGNLSVGGVLTYEDVTNIDSIGIITARSGINVSGGQLDVGSNIKIGNAGVITATSFSGALTGTASGNPTLTSGANNRVITATGANAIQGESNLTFDGDTLTAHMSSTTPAVIVGDSNRTGAGQHLAEFRGYWDGNHIARIVYAAGDDTTNKDDGVITMHTTPSGGGITERLRITSNGRVAIGNATNNASPTALLGVIADDGEAADLYVGKFHNLEATAGQSFGVDIRAGSNTSDHGFRVKNRANDTTQLLVRGDGKVGINETSPDNILHIKDSNPFIELEGTTNNSGDVGIFLNANGNHWQMRADNYPSQNAFSIKSGTPASSTHRFIISDTYIDTGTQTITGGNNLALQNFRVKGVWSGSPSIGKSIEIISGYDSAVKMAAIGYNLTDVNTGSTYGGDLTFHTQPLYSSPTTPLPERMRISSTGYVTKSVVPCWNLRPRYNSTQTTANTSSHHAIGWGANGTANSNFLQNCSLEASGFTYNIHNGQNYGKLKVPVAGRYYVNVTYRVENNPNQGNIYVYVNNSQIARQHVEMWGHRPYMHCQYASVLNLAANDTILISISCGNANISGYNDNVNWFSGYLIG